MQDRTYVEFTEEMKDDYTILVPNMLPIHFKLILSVMQTYGYKTRLLESSGPKIVETGLRYTHNDTCYPAMFVVGQFMDALHSGEYDPKKTALIMFQTGGGCRASNYISLIRKALKKANMEYVPVISFSMGVEKHSGFKLTIPFLHGLIYASLYGDLIMSLVNQTQPYEINKGDAEMLADKLTQMLGKQLGSGNKIRYSKVKENYKLIIKEFSAIPIEKQNKLKVGIVGEIFVKYSPLANNHLDSFLVGEGAEVVLPGLIDFITYCVYNSCMDRKLYKTKFSSYLLSLIAYKILCRKKDDIILSIKKNSSFTPWTPFKEIAEMTEGYISTAVKMGEGWLLTAEMLELIDAGCCNIVCTQPFGCLPNHICGKGMMKPIKEKNPDVNIVAIDYDASASNVNQENRLKLMLFNARRNEA